MSVLRVEVRCGSDEVAELGVLELLRSDSRRRIAFRMRPDFSTRDCRLPAVGKINTLHMFFSEVILKITNTRSALAGIQDKEEILLSSP